MTKIISANDLNIHLKKSDESSFFKWLFASFLMGKRIQASIAIDAYRVIVEKHQRDSSRKIAGCTQRDLVRMLGEARYTRYDESTANRLLKQAKKLNEECAGRVSSICDESVDREEFQARLQAFEGIGLKTVEIFMRDAHRVLF